MTKGKIRINKKQAIFAIHVKIIIKKNKVNFFSNIGYLKSNIFQEREIMTEKLQVLQCKEVRLIGVTS